MIELSYQMTFKGFYLHVKLNQKEQLYILLGKIHPIPLPRYLPTTVSNTKLKKKPVLGGLYHTYKKVA